MPMLIKCCVNNNMHEIISGKRGQLPIHATCAAHTLWKMYQSTFKKAFEHLNEEKVIYYQLEIGKYLANVLTECSSRHRSGWKWRSVKQTLLFIAMHYWGYGLLEVKGQTTNTFTGRCWTMWQRTGAVGEGGPAHSDDTLRGVLQLRWRTGSPWLLDHLMRRQGGRSNPHRHLTSIDAYSQ